MLIETIGILGSTRMPDGIVLHESLQEEAAALVRLPQIVWPLYAGKRMSHFGVKRSIDNQTAQNKSVVDKVYEENARCTFGTETTFGFAAKENTHEFQL